MKWFKHDTTAHTDAKLKKLKHKYGINGYGLYWYCLELIAGKVEAKNITFELEEDAELIALEWDLDQLKVQEIMGYMVSLGLFESSDGGIISCLKLAARLDDTTSRNPEIRKMIAKLNGNKVPEIEQTSETSEDSSDRTDKSRLEQIRLDKKGQPPADFSFPKHMAEQYGYAPHLYNAKDIATMSAWQTAEVTKEELHEAHRIACERKGTDTPSIAYINGIIKGTRKSEEQKLKKPKRKPRQSGQVESTDPLGEKTAEYEAEAARKLQEAIDGMKVA